MFTRLLVGLDGSPGAEAALGAAIDLGRRFGSTILLAAITDIRVLEAPMLGGGSALWSEGAPPSLNIAELGQVMDERAGALLGDAAARVAAAGLACEHLRAVGLVDEELVRLAEQAEAVVIGRRGEAHAEPGSVGAVTSHVIRKSPRPVVVAGEQPSAFAKPVVAYDGGSTSSNALALAARYAEAVQATLDVVTVSEDEAGDELLARAGAYLSGEHVAFTTHRLDGDVTHAIAAHVERTGADLLVAGAHGGRRKRPSWGAIGSHAEKLIKATSVPVIINR